MIQMIKLLFFFFQKKSKNFLNKKKKKKDKDINEENFNFFLHFFLFISIPKLFCLKPFPFKQTNPKSRNSGNNKRIRPTEYYPIGNIFFFKQDRISRKFYLRRNNNKVDSIQTGCIVIAHSFPEMI